MIRSVLIAITGFFLLVTPAFSANIGPVKSPIAGGDSFLGLGYSHTESKWEDIGSFSALKLQQDKFFAQAGFGLSKSWMTYLRAGISTHNADGALINSGDDFEGENVVPFVTLGMNGLFFENEVLSIGPFVQGTYYLGENKDSSKFSSVLVPATGFETVEETATLDNMWEAKAGLQFQLELEGAQLYGGPMYYISRADIEDRLVGAISGPWATVSKTVEEEDNLGFVVGVQWRLLEDVTLDLEAQLRSSYDLGLVLNKRF